MTCSYAKCTNDARIKRRYTGDGEVYSYCPEHDPLQEDSPVADVYEALDG